MIDYKKTTFIGYHYCGRLYVDNKDPLTLIAQDNYTGEVFKTQMKYDTVQSLQNYLENWLKIHRSCGTVHGPHDPGDEND